MASLGRLGHVFKEHIWKLCLQLQQMTVMISNLVLVWVLRLLILLSH